MRKLVIDVFMPDNTTKLLSVEIPLPETAFTPILESPALKFRAQVLEDSTVIYTMCDEK